jgi:D-galactarolactone cycloisomerase
VRITSVETFPLRLPAESAYLGPLPSGAEPPEAEYYVRPPWRSLYSHRYETMLVRLEAEDGTAGWGEALAPVGPEIPAQIVELLLRPVLLGSDADRPKPVTAELRALMRERGHLVGHQADALAAVDTALWDLAARIHGVSVVSLLGGAFRDEVPTYVSGLPRPDDAGRAALASEWADRGASAVKLHLGHGVAEDLRTVDAVQAAAPTLKVAVDAHWAYSLSDALSLADGLATRGASFLEAPLPPEDIRGHARLVAHSGVPIAVGESLRNRYEFAQWLDAGALQVAQPDVARTGITELMAIAELCSSQHVNVAPHHSVGLTVSAAAGLAVSAAIENLLLFEYQPTSLAVGTAALGSTLAMMPNLMTVPTGPGLGVEVDRTLVQHLRKESER